VNVTVPVGVPVPETGATVAVTVADWPVTDGFGLEAIVVVVLAVLMFAATELVTSESMETELESGFATNISPLEGSYTAATGAVPTDVVATTVLVASEITDAELEL